MREAFFYVCHSCGGRNLTTVGRVKRLLKIVFKRSELLVLIVNARSLRRSNRYNLGRDKLM
ncbi:MAG: hypothetical protein V4642_06605 [Bacteroidota bacterium]